MDKAISMEVNQSISAHVDSEYSNYDQYDTPYLANVYTFRFSFSFNNDNLHELFVQTSYYVFTKVGHDSD